MLVGQGDPRMVHDKSFESVPIELQGPHFDETVDARIARMGS